MKENVIDVLMFLFDNYLCLEEGMVTDEETLTFELEEAGFPMQEITKAFDWLGELADDRYWAPSFVQAPSNNLRIYAPEELEKLDASCRGFLQSLEWGGLLDPMTREIIIDRAMAIEVDGLGLAPFKRIVGLVMMNRAPEVYATIYFEDLLEDVPQGLLH